MAVESSRISGGLVYRFPVFENLHRRSRSCAMHHRPEVSQVRQRCAGIGADCPACGNIDEGVDILHLEGDPVLAAIIV